MENEAAGSSPARPTISTVTSENADQSVLSNAVSFCASHAHSGLRTHPCRDHQVLSEACVRSAETVRRPHQPGGLCFAPSTSALWGEWRQPSALTAGRPGDEEPVPSIRVRRVSPSLLVVLDALRNVVCARSCSRPLGVRSALDPAADG